MRSFASLLLGLSLVASAVAVPLGNLGNGITAKESASGDGYILFSPTDLSSRLTLYPNQATNFVAVYYQNDIWYYYNNEFAVAFTPVSTDVLVASVNYSTDTASLLSGQNTFTNGIQTGYAGGDLGIIVNQWNGVANPGEFTATGTNIVLNVPQWWTDRGVTNASTPNNFSVANIGQAKHVASMALAELDSLLPGGAGVSTDGIFPNPPANPDTAWYHSQKKVLNLGQLKAVAKPFYDRLNEINSFWVKEQMELNGLTVTGSPPYYPWNPDTPVNENYKPANIGQLKAVFSLRFGSDADSDSLNDLVELAMYGDTSGDGTTTDYDGDGLSDALEITHGTSSLEIDTDHDGVSDGDEVTASTDPLTAATTSNSAITLEVWTVLE